MGKAQQVVHYLEHSDDPLNWDDIRLFLSVAQTKSLRAAADEIGLSVNVLRSRIEALERQSNAVLLIRTARGSVLTEEGRRVVSIGEEMLRQAKLFAHFSQRPKPGLRSTVRIGITEGLGTFWLIPRITEFSTAEPSIRCSIKCEMRMPDVSGLEVDFAIQLERPDDPELVVQRLGWLHICLFASRRYVERFGQPATSAEVPQHPYVDLVADQIPTVEEVITPADKRGFVGIQVNTSSAQVLAVTGGAGIAALPTYARALCPSLIHVARDFALKRDVWLVHNPRAAELMHVRKAINWVKRSFDQARFPWFRQSFIAPDDLVPTLDAFGDDLFASYKDSPLFR
ncbi:MAG: LysR family transcriptional regulator [Proteobacteria bacterium]|nr:LysR family transcriptional regulator [Pseudomonadota bacterium]